MLYTVSLIKIKSSEEYIFLNNSSKDKIELKELSWLCVWVLLLS